MRNGGSQMNVTAEALDWSSVSYLSCCWPGLDRDE